MAYTFAHDTPHVRRAFSFMNSNALAHLRIRASSWSMSVINLAVGLVMVANPDVLTNNPGAHVYFSHLISAITPEMWRNLFVVIGGLRLMALYVNGTFPSLWWTPHLRLAMALVSFGIWMQFAISVFASGVLTIGTVLYCATVAVEGFNVAVAASETRPRGEGDFG